MHKRFRHLCLALAALIAAGTLLAALIPAAEAATFPQGGRLQSGLPSLEGEGFCV